eukprot:CAMPEP_0194349102 /NCGR_PEP_ID=MMETSP0171-20130528/106903_1 /TAXON_ID=218684 /ORGANISM="Corethron pennatum, Strain L29A3" /LENGTH=443 /DNA_ID=CAMNT_0039116515 /DNA_START=33 /DNA_END=1364 /DNA_ORIENTATION=+
MPDRPRSVGHTVDRNGHTVDRSHSVRSLIDSYVPAEPIESYTKYPNPTPNVLHTKDELNEIVTKYNSMSMSFEEIAAEIASSKTEEGEEEEEEPAWPNIMTTEIKTSRSVVHDEIRGKKTRLERMNKSRSVPSRHGYKEEESDADADGTSVRHVGSIEEIRLALSLGERVERLIEKSVSMVTGEKTYSWYTPGKNCEKLHNVNDPAAKAPSKDGSESSDLDCSESPDLDCSKSPDLDCSNVGEDITTGCNFAENIAAGTCPGGRTNGWLLAKKTRRTFARRMSKEDDDDTGSRNIQERPKEVVPESPLAFSLGEAVENVIEGSVRNLTSGKSYEWTRHKKKVARAAFRAAAAAAAETAAETDADEGDDGDEWIPASNDNWDLPLDERQDANEEDLISTKKMEQQQQQEADIGASIEDSDLEIAKIDCMYAIGFEVHKAFGAVG